LAAPADRCWAADLSSRSLPHPPPLPRLVHPLAATTTTSTPAATTSKHHQNLIKDASGRSVGGFDAERETTIYFEQLTRSWN
jgi:hypothetical protein